MRLLLATLLLAGVAQARNPAFHYNSVQNGRSLAMIKVKRLNKELYDEYGIHILMKSVVTQVPRGAIGIAFGSITCDKKAYTILSESYVLNQSDKKVKLLILHEYGHQMGLAHDRLSNPNLSSVPTFVLRKTKKGFTFKMITKSCPTTLMYPSMAVQKCLDNHFEYYIDEFKMRLQIASLGIPSIPFFTHGCSNIQPGKHVKGLSPKKEPKCVDHEYDYNKEVRK